MGLPSTEPGKEGETVPTATKIPPGQKVVVRRKRGRKTREKEEICCERCNNYNRDCCCTFSCHICGKRVFSSAAFMTHQRMHNSNLPPNFKKDRIRAAIMEKRKRKKLILAAKSKGEHKKTKVIHNLINPNTSSHSITTLQPMKQSSHSSSSPPPHLPIVAAETKVEGGIEESPDDETSSLTDLSTFTASNLLNDDSKSSNQYESSTTTTTTTQD